MIRKTLRHTQLATYTVGVADAHSGIATPRPAGTGFFVAQDGLFVTAAHVIKDARPAVLLKESTGGQAETAIDVVDVLIHDDAADFALLQVDLDRVRSTITTLKPSARELDEGEPVYAFGYPLPVTSPQVELTTDQLREQLPKELLERIRGPQGQPLAFGVTGGMINALLSPRATSAIVASRVEYHATIDVEGVNDMRHHIVIDKALNYGNSGGPIVATETGFVHGLCSRFQPVAVHQPHLQNVPIELPSLYGVVTRLTHPVIRAELEQRGVAFAAT